MTATTDNRPETPAVATARRLIAAWPKGSHEKGLIAEEYDTLSRRVFNVPAFDGASLGVAQAEMASARLVRRAQVRRAEGYPAEVRFFPVAEIPEDLWLSASERLMREDQRRLDEGAAERRRGEEMRREQDRREYELQHQFDYVNSVPHIDERLTELAAAGALRVDAEGCVVIVPEKVPPPETGPRPVEIVGVRF